MWGELLSILVLRVVRLCTQLILRLTNFKYLALNIDLQDTYDIKYACFVCLCRWNQILVVIFSTFKEKKS